MRFISNWNSPSNLAIPSASFLKGAREEKLAQSDLKQNQCINYYYLSDLAICDSLPLSHLLFPWAPRFSNEYYENLVSQIIHSIYTSGGTGSCNWNMARDSCEANDFGLSARRVPEKIYLYPVDKNRQTTSQLWIHSGTRKRSLIAKLLKFTFKLLKYVFESYYCLLIYIDDWFCCMHSTEEQARVSCSNLIANSCFMRNSITAGGTFFPLHCVFHAIHFVNYCEAKT